MWVVTQDVFFCRKSLQEIRWYGIKVDKDYFHSKS